mmetsp:Transcript_14756/g.48383  ORF Transcript_14756/g.48383 Transcript_14756/m.48383 type:complete len:219 (-) Transcript_14756:45-701(-)
MIDLFFHVNCCASVLISSSFNFSFERSKITERSSCAFAASAPSNSAFIFASCSEMTARTSSMCLTKPLAVTPPSPASPNAASIRSRTGSSAPFPSSAASSASAVNIPSSSSARKMLPATGAARARRSASATPSRSPTRPASAPARLFSSSTTSADCTTPSVRRFAATSAEIFCSSSSPESTSKRSTKRSYSSGRIWFTSWSAFAVQRGTFLEVFRALR